MVRKYLTEKESRDLKEGKTKKSYSPSSRSTNSSAHNSTNLALKPELKPYNTDNEVPAFDYAPKDLESEAKIDSYARDQEMKSMGFSDKQIYSYKESEEKWAETNPNTTELERILEGRRQQYWKIKDRLSALEQYVSSKEAIADIEKLQKKGKYQEISLMINKLKSGKSTNKLSKDYVDSTFGKLENYLFSRYPINLELRAKRMAMNKQESNKMEDNYNTHFKRLEAVKKYTSLITQPIENTFSKIWHGFGKLFTYLEHNGLGNKPASEYMQVKSQKLEFKQRQRKPEIAMQKPVKAERKITPKVIPDNIVSLSQEREKRNPSYFTAGKRIAAGIIATVGFLWNTPSYAPENKPENKNERVEVSQRDNFSFIYQPQYNSMLSYDYTSNLINENTSSNILSLEYILGEKKY